MRHLKVDLSDSNVLTRNLSSPRLDGYPNFVFTPDTDIAKAIVAMGEMSDYENMVDELPNVLVSILMFGLVSSEEEAMRAFERSSVHFRSPYSGGYFDFWNHFQALHHVFNKRYSHDEALKNMITDHLPQDCNYCEEGVLRVRRSRSGRHYLIG